MLFSERAVKTLSHAKAVATYQHLVYTGTGLSVGHPNFVHFETSGSFPQEMACVELLQEPQNFPPR